MQSALKARQFWAAPTSERQCRCCGETGRIDPSSLIAKSFGTPRYWETEARAMVNSLPWSWNESSSAASDRVTTLHRSSRSLTTRTWPTTRNRVRPSSESSPITSTSVSPSACRLAARGTAIHAIG